MDWANLLNIIFYFTIFSKFHQPLCGRELGQTQYLPSKGAHLVSSHRFTYGGTFIIFRQFSKFRNYPEWLVCGIGPIAIFGGWCLRRFRHGTDVKHVLTFLGGRPIWALGNENFCAWHIFFSFLVFSRRTLIFFFLLNNRTP